MTTLDLCQELSRNPYPGRGIVLGRTADNRHAVIAYFIMGRSENSRNRIFEETDDGIRTRAYDESKMTDPSLIIYHPVRQVGEDTIVTNGDQTDTIQQGLLAGKTFAESLRSRCFEPDPPNYTPRISGLLLKDGSYKLSILKSAYGNPDCNLRYFYEYDAPLPGTDTIPNSAPCSRQTRSMIIVPIPLPPDLLVLNAVNIVFSSCGVTPRPESENSTVRKSASE